MKYIKDRQEYKQYEIGYINNYDNECSRDCLSELNLKNDHVWFVVGDRESKKENVIGVTWLG